MTQYRKLTSTVLPHDARVCEPDHAREGRLEMHAPAVDAMTDLRRVRAVTVGPQASVEAAQQRMVAAQVRLLLVVDSQDAVLGLVTARDLLGEKPTRIAVEDGIAHGAVSIERVMVRHDRVQVLDFADVQHSSVGDIVATLHDSGRQHALVLERGATPRVRGIFSITRIGRRLGVQLDANERPQSFAEIEHLLASG